LIIVAKDDILRTKTYSMQEITLATDEAEAEFSQQKALINQSIRGDAEAFKKLVEGFRSMVFNLSLRLTGDYNEALDLSQDVLLKIYLNLKSFRYQSSFQTWIYRLTINTARNRYYWWKRRRKQQTISLGSLQDIPQQRDIDDPEKLLLRNELKRKIQQGISRLRFHYSSVLILRDIEMLSYEEISQILNISQGTVKSRLSRARSLLKEHLKDYLRKMPQN